MPYQMMQKQDAWIPNGYRKKTVQQASQRSQGHRHWYTITLDTSIQFNNFSPRIYGASNPIAFYKATIEMDPHLGLAKVLFM